MRDSLPAGDLLFTNRVVKNSRVLIEGQEFPADLIALDIRDFDVVLGMDWLSRHISALDCYKNEVKFCRPEKLEVKYRGIRRELSSSMISKEYVGECCLKLSGLSSLCGGDREGGDYGG